MQNEKCKMKNDFDARRRVDSMLPLLSLFSLRLEDLTGHSVSPFQG